MFVLQNQFYINEKPTKSMYNMQKSPLFPEIKRKKNQTIKSVTQGQIMNLLQLFRIKFHLLF